MELTLQRRPLCFLRCVAQTLQYQEETGETVLPDNEPDLISVADCAAEVLLRGKDVRDGGVVVAGGVKGSILCRTEGSAAPRTLECYLPFTIKVEHPAITERSAVLCELRVRSADARVLNARKALLRVSIGCALAAYQEAAESISTLEGACPGLEARETTLELELPLEAGERSFVISEALEVPAGRPPIAQLCRCRCDVAVTERKLVGSKALFKGTLTCKALYRGPDDSLNQFTQSLPFSQYCELEREYDREQVTVLPVLTGCDVESEGGAEPRRLLLTAHVLAQCLVTGQKTVRVVEDAYAIRGQLEPQWQTIEVSPCLDRQSRVETVQGSLSAPLSQVVDVEAYVDFPSQNRSGDGVELKTPVLFRVLGYDGDGELQAVAAQGEALESVALAPSADCAARAALADGLESVAVSGGQVRCALRLDTACFARQALRSLASASLEPEQEAAERPSVILRAASGETSLWELAKDCRSSEAAIRAVNHLEGDRLPRDAMLLIPVG